MGTRITYYRNNDGRALKDLLAENYVQFREWYLQQEVLSRDDFGEPFGNAHIKQHLLTSEFLQSDLDLLNKSLVDELTAEFLCTYLDLANRPDTPLELFGPCINKFHYQRCAPLVSATNDHNFLRLWKYVLEGRLLKDGNDFNSYSNDNKIGYLSIDEAFELKRKIERYFSESLEDEPSNEGFRSVLEAIACLDDKNAELVVHIEMDS